LLISTSLQSSRVPVLSVHDGEPGLLDNIGSIVGVKQKCLAIRKTSKSGTTWDIFAYHGIDADSIVEETEGLLKEAAEEKFVVAKEVVEATTEVATGDRVGLAYVSPLRSVVGDSERLREGFSGSYFKHR
jgi:pyruvate dehydrogenase complex dehydrogenase (E1) component